MNDLLATLPRAVREVRYDASKVPDGSHDLSQGANCQRFAYAVLAQFGVELPPFRSSELWADSQHSRVVSDLQPLDLLLFGRRRESYGAHVGVYVGKGRVLHLSALVGTPATWFLSEFPLHEKYVCCIGAKRVLHGEQKEEYPHLASP